MKAKIYLKSIYVIIVLSFTSCGDFSSLPSNSINERPNIVVILCDDLGYSDVGFNGAKDIITPELDHLAYNGMRFSAAYVAHPFCGPSRAGLMTGRYPHTFGSQFNLPQNSGELLNTGIPLEETFISKVLQNAGYYTGIVGKWHLGAVPEYHPLNRGFDDFYGFLGGGHRYFPSQYQPIYEKQKAEGKTIINDYLKPLEYNNNEVRETEYITDALSREAARFVDEASKKENPFFLYLAYNAPHSPLEAKEEDLTKFNFIKDKKRKTYAAMVYAVDRGVGKLVNALKRNNQLDNTLIIFLSDNGGKVALGATNAPLQKGKGSTQEGGYRVPMFFHWPKGIKGGNIFEHPVSAIDFYPTFASLAKAEIPKTKILHGKDIWNDLTQGSEPHKNEMIYALRHREGYSDVGARKGDWKILKTNQNNWKLFNIKKDISEQNDLSDQYPEQMQEMILEVKSWTKAHIEPKWYDPDSLKYLWKTHEMNAFKTVFDLEE